MAWHSWHGALLRTGVRIWLLHLRVPPFPERKLQLAYCATAHNNLFFQRRGQFSWFIIEFILESENYSFSLKRIFSVVFLIGLDFPSVCISQHKLMRGAKSGGALKQRQQF